ncbi:mitochondrial carrier domain-containing protein [Pilobolus umbonatus]|nr:mitochondrial carrier domain-containing protein [Pilobolus umbonatus]
MLDVEEIPESIISHNVNSFMAGVVAGLAGLAVGHPFVKVRLQSRELSRHYTGTWNCFVTTVKQEKFLGLYKGMVGAVVANALVFGCYPWLIEHQATLFNTKLDTAYPPLWHVFTAGMGSGIITSFVTCPMELAKVQLQNQTNMDTHLKGPVDCMQQMYRMGGIRYCFKGLFPTILRELSFGTYFLTYEAVCRAFTPKDKQLPNELYELTGEKIIVAGGAAGTMAWISTYFADVIKTRIQAEPYRYKGFMDCMRLCYREGGWTIFFRGLTPTILRAFPSNAATFVAYAYTMRLFQNNRLLTKKANEEAYL